MKKNYFKILITWTFINIFCVNVTTAIFMIFSNGHKSQKVVIVLFYWGVRGNNWAQIKFHSKQIFCYYCESNYISSLRPNIQYISMTKSYKKYRVVKAECLLVLKVCAIMKYNISNGICVSKREVVWIIFLGTFI